MKAVKGNGEVKDDEKVILSVGTLNYLSPYIINEEVQGRPGF